MDTAGLTMHVMCVKKLPNPDKEGEGKNEEIKAKVIDKYRGDDELSPSLKSLLQFSQESLFKCLREKIYFFDLKVALT